MHEKAEYLKKMEFQNIYHDEFGMTLGDRRIIKNDMAYSYVR